MVSRDVPADRRRAYWTSRAAAGHGELASRATGTVVVVACGDGSALPTMEAAGARGVIGVDADPAVVARTRTRHATDSIEVVEAELTDLPLVNDTYDTVVSWHGLSAGANAGQVLAEMARITRPGGVVGIVTSNARAMGGAAIQDGADASGGSVFHAANLETAMVGAGLAVTSMHGIAHATPLAVRLTAAGADAVARLAESTWDIDLAEAVGPAAIEDFAATRDLARCVDLVAWATPA